MSRKNPDPNKEAVALSLPTAYTVDFRDVPVEKYAKALSALFADSAFEVELSKRNQLVRSADRLPHGSAQLSGLINAIRQRDRRLADTVYATIVQANVHSDVQCDFLSFGTLLRYFVDYTVPDMEERVDRLACNLDRITFLADMIQSLMIDVQCDMKGIFGSGIEFRQFDAVSHVLRQMQTYFDATCSQSAPEADRNLYMDYANSINDYLEKRMRTFSDKYRKLHPASFTRTPGDMAEALTDYFNMDYNTAMQCISRTETGGFYIDIVKVLKPLTAEQFRKLLRNVDGSVDLYARTPSQKDSFTVSDIILSQYRKKK